METRKLGTLKKEKPKYNAWQNSLFMVKLAWQEKKKLVLLLAVLIAFFEVVISFLGLLVAPAILEAVETQRPLPEFLMTILLFIVPLIVTRMLLTFCEANTMMGRIDIRLSIVRKLNGKFLQTSYPNTLKDDMQKKMKQAQSATAGNDRATEAIWTTLSNLLKNSLGFILYLFLLAHLNPLLIGIIALTTISSFLIGKHLNGWGYRHRDEEGAYRKQMNFVLDKANESVLAKDVRIFGMGNWLDSVYEKGFDLFRGFVVRREKVYFGTDLSDLLFAFFRNGIAYIYLIGLVLNGHLTSYAIVLYFTAIGGFTTWISGILSELGTLNKQSLELSMVREFLEYPEPFQFTGGKPLSPSVHERYELELRNVTFAYEGAEKNTLENINLKITAGEKLAIVGINGAGKTTLVKLLCGLLDPTAGEVLLNGTNIKTYNRKEYYQLFSAVFQDFSIMAGTISQNVAQRGEGIDYKRVGECLAKAGIYDKVAALPQGLDTKLEKLVFEEAIELSGGQTQRLMLARALYKNGPILVLDEPTAALDPIAESEIYEAYNDLTAGRTAIYISHRLASTGFCNRIILLDGQKLEEMGTHQELVAKGGKYAEMFKIQSRYYQEGAGVGYE